MRGYIMLSARPLTVAFALVAATLMSAGTASANPFKTLSGSWKGSGKVSPLGGRAERVSCRVGYQVSGGSITQTLRCAGTDYRISATGNLSLSGTTITGSWRESTYGVGGSVRGSAKGNGVYLRISSKEFNGRMVITLSNRSNHTVKITQFDAGSGKYTPLANMALKR